MKRVAKQKQLFHLFSLIDSSGKSPGNNLILKFIFIILKAGLSQITKNHPIELEVSIQSYIKGGKKRYFKTADYGNMGITFSLGNT